MLSLAAQTTEPPSGVVLAMPFVVALGIQLLTLIATYAVGRRVPSLINERVPSEELKHPPDALQPDPIRQIAEWAIDAAGALASVVGPLVGLMILVPEAGGVVLAIAYIFTFVLSLALFVWVL